MFMALQLTIGLREVNTIALSWMLISLTMVFGLLTETWSRPAPRDPDGYRGWVGDPPRTNEIMAIEEKRRTHRDRNYVQRPEGPVNYVYEQTMREANSAQRWNYNNQFAGPPPAALEPHEKELLRQYATAYTYNYFYRYASPAPFPIQPALFPTLPFPCSQDATSFHRLVPVYSGVGGFFQPFPLPAQRSPARGRGYL